MLDAETRLDLPPRPADLAHRAVAAWWQSVTIPTYLPEPPDRYPAYLHQRVYQGSSGRVYPLPFHDRISRERIEHPWDAVHLENAWLRLLILPGLGGRIHVAVDKVNDYDLFYRNPVIKPALVGLAGPWIAGGVEFNWPQHHRPATFLPTSATIEVEADGAVTVWCSDHDPFTRMKGMHGVRLHPDRAEIEVRVRLYNRSEETQTFLWWANVAARVHADYQSFFPADVHVVADHAKRAVSTFPAAHGTYYGVDYPARRGLTRVGGSDREVPGDRLDWYRNIPVPTSYMALDSAGDFFGGYDHRAQAGFVHWADHHYAVGKKQWSWGSAPFGDAWCRNLADDDASYVELMAGVFTDNQPDFAFLAPGETKVFSQFWLPVAGTGPVRAATREAALGVVRATGSDHDETSVEVTVSSTRSFAGAELQLRGPAGLLGSAVVDLLPVRPSQHRFVLGGRPAEPLQLELRHDGRRVVSWRSADPSSEVRPEPATEPPSPAATATVEELHLTGVHLQQYRHATRSPEPYWEEALARDPGHVGANTALAGVRYRQARFAESERHLRRAIERLTMLNPNPEDGEPHYRLGLTLQRLGRDAEAYDALARSSWNRAWRSPAAFQLARIDARHGRDHDALHRVEQGLAVEPDHLQARALRVVVLRRLGRLDEAAALLAATRTTDPLDAWAVALDPAATAHRAQLDAQTLLDVALESAAVGETATALRLLAEVVARDADRTVGQPACGVTAHYHRAALLDRVGDATGAADARAAARRADPSWNFPGRLDDALALLAAVRADDADARAHGQLGHWLYAHDRPADARDAWQTSVERDPADAVVWRNLGLARFVLDADAASAATAYEHALRIAPDHARLWYERDQLAQRTGEPVRRRLDRLSRVAAAVAGRDDLTVEYAGLLVADGRADEAATLLAGRDFQPWEGGEGQALSAWERAHLALADTAILHGDGDTAVRHAQLALTVPASLGEARHELANPAQLLLTLGDALHLAGRPGATAAWSDAAAAVGDFGGMAPQPYSAKTFFSVLACQRLGLARQADELTERLRQHADTLAVTPATVDYFATSLPAMLLFPADPEDVRDQLVAVLRAQLSVLDGDRDRAAAGVAAVVAQDPAHEIGVDLRRWLPGAHPAVAVPRPGLVPTARSAS